MSRFTVIALSAIALLSSTAQAQRSDPFGDRNPNRPIFVDYPVPCEVRFDDDCPAKKPKPICLERYEDGRCALWKEPRIVCEWDGGFGNSCAPVKKPRRVCLDRVDGRCIEWDLLD